MDTKITLNNLDSSLLLRLNFEAKSKGMYLNSLILDLIRKSLGLEQKPTVKSGFRSFEQLAGTWSEEEYNEFMANTEMFNKIDEELWK